MIFILGRLADHSHGDSFSQRPSYEPSFRFPPVLVCRRSRATIGPKLRSLSKCLVGPRRGLDLRFLCERQGVFDVDTEVADRALDLGMPEQDLYGAQVARLLVDYRGLGSAERVRDVVLTPKAGSVDSFLHEPSILARADVLSVVDPAREHMVGHRTSSALQPRAQAALGVVEQLELHRPLRLLLDHDGAGTDAAAQHDVADLDLDDVAASQLAVDREVEHGAVAHALLAVEPEPDGPDLLRLEGPLGSKLPSGVPRRFPLRARILF